MRFPADDICQEKRIPNRRKTTDQAVSGAVGLQIAQRQGRLHSESSRILPWLETCGLQFGSACRRSPTSRTGDGVTQEQAPFWSHAVWTKPVTKSWKSFRQLEQRSLDPGSR